MLRTNLAQCQYFPAGGKLPLLKCIILCTNLHATYTTCSYGEILVKSHHLQIRALQIGNAVRKWHRVFFFKTAVLSHFPLGRLCCTPNSLIGVLSHFFLERLRSSCVCRRSVDLRMVLVPHMVITVSVNQKKFYTGKQCASNSKGFEQHVLF